MKRRTERAVGRPRAEQDPEARSRLVVTAARLFAAQGYAGTSLREVARGADVTPAMVAYYFGDKAGLLEAVVIDGLERLLGAVRGAVAEHEPGPFVPAMIRRYLATVSAVPWIPQLLMREVISRDTPLRALFIERFAKEALALVPQKVIEEIQRGRIRDDLDPRYTIMSLIGMCLFPFLARPVLGPLLGYDLDPEFGVRYAEHTVKLFLGGASGGAP